MVHRNTATGSTPVMEVNQEVLYSLHNFSCLCYWLPTSFSSKLTKLNIISGTLSECQTVWIKARTDVLSVLAHRL